MHNAFTLLQCQNTQVKPSSFTVRFFKTEPHDVTQPGLEFVILLPLPLRLQTRTTLRPPPSSEYICDPRSLVYFPQVMGKLCHKGPNVF